MSKFFFILLLAFWPGVSSCDETGVNYFALPGYTEEQTTLALSVFDGLEDLKLGTIWKAFGSRNENIKRFFDYRPEKDHTLRLDITNETCRRWPRYCTRYDTIFPRKNAAAFNRYAAAHPRRVRLYMARRVRNARTWMDAAGIRSDSVIITAGLEDNYNDATYKIIRSAIKSEWTGRLARNPVLHSAGAHSSDLIELHSDKCSVIRRTSIWSNDGHAFCETRAGRTDPNCRKTDVLFNAARCWRRLGNFTFLWWNNQGASNPGTKFVEPRRRNLRIYPEDVHFINNILRSLNDGNY